MGGGGGGLGVGGGPSCRWHPSQDRDTPVVGFQAATGCQGMLFISPICTHTPPFACLFLTLTLRHGLNIIRIVAILQFWGDYFEIYFTKQSQSYRVGISYCNFYHLIYGCVKVANSVFVMQVFSFPSVFNSGVSCAVDRLSYS